MAALHEIQGRWHPGNRMGADGERRPDADRRCLHQRRRHRRRGLPGGHHVNRLPGEPGPRLSIGQRPRDDTRSGYAIQCGLDYVEQIGCEGWYQWTFRGSDQAERPVTTSNSRSRRAITSSASAFPERCSRSAITRWSALFDPANGLLGEVLTLGLQALVMLEELFAVELDER